MDTDYKNEERTIIETNIEKVKTPPKTKRVNKEKRNELYKELIKKNKDIYKRLSK